MSAAALLATMAGAGSAILISSSSTEAAKVRTDTEVVSALAEADPGAPVENFLLVGSDTRATADPNSPDFGAIGDAETTTGQRSDTIMVLRHNRETGEAALLSLPRDLWLPIAGTEHSNRINSAFSKGTDVLVNTITENLGIEINHYVEVDFGGFKTLVDAIGGVPVCFDYPTRDKNTGLNITNPGCWELDGLQGLQYTRSRHFEEFRDSEWREDPTSDLGRIKRQQEFLVTALDRANGRLVENPFIINDLLQAAQLAVTLDPTVELLSLGRRFSDLVGEDLFTFQLAVSNETIDGNDVLIMDEEKSQAVLDYFRGLAPAMATTTTTP